MLLLATFLLGIYGAILLFWFSQKSKLQDREPSAAPSTRFSVVIAFRNEAENISNLLDSLSQINYPRELWELILVDDHSEDGGVEIISSHENALGINLLSNTNKGKKSALDLGINAALYEQILLTDADCRVHTDWLRTLDSYRQDKTIILGPVKLTGLDTYWSYFQKVDFAMMQFATALSLKAGQLFLANGANLSYPKKYFTDSEGFENHDTPSGDDILFIQNLSSSEMDFAFSKNAIVETPVSKTLKNFVEQRLRWGSKTKNYNSKYALLVSLLFFLLNLIISLGLLSLVFHPEDSRKWLLLVFCKFLMEYLMLRPALRFFDIPVSFFKMLLLQIPHIFYMSILGIASQVKSYKWKDREY